MSERREPSRPTGVGQSGSPRGVLVHGSSLDVWDNSQPMYRLRICVHGFGTHRNDQIRTLILIAV